MMKVAFMQMITQVMPGTGCIAFGNITEESVAGFVKVNTFCRRREEAKLSMSQIL